MKHKNILLCGLVILISVVALKINAQGSGQSAEKQFSRCAAIRMKEINLGHLEENPDKYTTPVPAGWTVVSGTGGQGHPKLLLCQ